MIFVAAKTLGNKLVEIWLPFFGLNFYIESSLLGRIDSLCILH